MQSGGETGGAFACSGVATHAKGVLGILYHPKYAFSSFTSSHHHPVALINQNSAITANAEKLR